MEESIQTVMNDLHSGESNRQFGALNALSRVEEIRTQVSFQEILPFLSSEEEFVREEAATCLGYYAANREEVGSALVHVLSDANEMVRGQAVESLGWLEYTPALEAIKDCLHHDPEWYVRVCAADALGYFDDQSLLDNLQQALKDEAHPVQTHAAIAIRFSATPDFLPVLRSSIEAIDDPAVKAELLVTGYYLGDAEYLRQLVLMLRDVTDRDVAGSILNAIHALSF